MIKKKITHNLTGNSAAVRARRYGRAGFSLVEVLVAIAILTIGIVAFFQLFPIGFYNLQVAANTSNADRLAQAELQRLTNGDGTQVQQIAAIEQVYSDFTVQLDPNFDPDAGLRIKTQLNNTGFDYTRLTSIGDERYGYVGGETVRISNPGSNTTSNVLLDFGPFEVPQSYSSTSLPAFNSLDPGQHASFYVHGFPWAGISGSSAPASSGGGTESIPHDDPEVELAQDSPEYLIDYANGALALRDPTGRYTQKIIFQVRDSDTSTAAVEPKTFILTTDWTGTKTQSAEPANTLACWDPTYSKPVWTPLSSTSFSITAINQPTTATQTLVLPLQSGTDKLVRDFQLVPAFNNTTDPDPYQYTFPATLGTAPAPDNRFVYDRILFNPLAAHIVDNRGQPLKASVDYIVSDWHTIHEDRTSGSQLVASATGTTTSAIRLTLNHLLQLNSPDQFNNPYKGIGYGGSPVIVYDLDTQATLAYGTDYTVDFDNGVVTLRGQPAETHVRVYYHPAYDWGLAVIKPAANYQVVTNGSVATPQLTGQAVLVGATELDFPLCDHDRLVQVGNVVLKDSDPTKPAFTTVPIQQLVKLQPATGSTTGLPAIQLTSYGVTPSATQTVYGVTVSGASITTRVIWRERDLWRHRDVTTVNLPTSS